MPETKPIEPLSAETLHAFQRVHEWWNWSGPRPEAPAHSIGALVNSFEALLAENGKLKAERDEAVALLDDWQGSAERAVTAEADRDAARARALEEAASMVEKLDLIWQNSVAMAVEAKYEHPDRISTMYAKAIRALIARSALAGTEKTGV